MLESNNAQILKRVVLLKSNTSQISKLSDSFKSNTQIGQHTFSFKSNINQISRHDIFSNQTRIKYFFMKVLSNKHNLKSFIKYCSNIYTWIFKISCHFLKGFRIRRKREGPLYYRLNYFHHCIALILSNNTNC